LTILIRSPRLASNIAAKAPPSQRILAAAAASRGAENGALVYYNLGAFGLSLFADIQ
jgi:hypothetical protein